jgi:hypothetical protein
METMQKIGKYYKTIFSRSWHRFSKTHPLFDIVAPLLVGFSVGLLSSYRVAGEVEPMITAVITIIATVLIYVIVYGFFFFREPVILHEESEQRINELSNADKIILVAVNDEEHITSGIRIENGEDRAFTGQLFLVKFAGKPMDTIFELGMYMQYNRVSLLEYPPTLSRIIEFSQIDKESRNAFIIGIENRAWKNLDSGEYELETQLSGKLGAQEIKSKRTKWLLKIDKENLKTELLSNSAT